MPFGDEKLPFKPPHRVLRCSRCKRDVYITAVRKCPHEAVKRAYGENAQICLDCCKKKPCRYLYKMPYCGVFECRYTNCNHEE